MVRKPNPLRIERVAAVTDSGFLSILPQVAGTKNTPLIG
jgi:hypothetical protein